MSKMGLISDDRLTRDRKKNFERNLSIFKFKYSIETLSSSMTEDSFLDLLEKSDYSVVMIPWYLYFTWKKAAHLHETRVVGYFAEPVLQFEFQTVPNYPNFIMLDFYRFEVPEIEVLIKLLITDESTEMAEIFGKTGHITPMEWSQKDQSSTQCIDTALSQATSQCPTFQERKANLRLFLTALWLTCFQDKQMHPTDAMAAKLEICELNKKIYIKLNFYSSSLNSKDMIEMIWPNSHHKNILLREMSRQCDFIKIHHFPGTRRVSITGFFHPLKPLEPTHGEVHGFWIENRL